MKKLTLLFISVICLCTIFSNLCLVYIIKNSNDYQNKTGRYQIYMHPEFRADQFLIDTQTGRIWQLTQESKEKYMFWHEMPIDELIIEDYQKTTNNNN